jgi:hypothetical protein
MKKKDDRGFWPSDFCAPLPFSGKLNERDPLTKVNKNISQSNKPNQHPLSLV